MKIIELQSENFKSLTVRVRMDGKSVTVEGKNGTGKTTFMDAIWIALTGKDVPAEPIRQGETSARISVTVKNDDGTEFIVERLFTKSGSKLTVKTADGAKFSSPQAFLDAKIGKISFDPFEFINKAPRDQKKFLMELLGIDLTIFDDKKRTLLTDHGTIQKKYANEIGVLATMPPYDETLTERSTAEAISKFNEINIARKEVEDRKALFDKLDIEIDTLTDRMASLRTQYEEAKAQRAEKKEKFSKLLEIGFDMPEVGNLQAEIEEINTHNDRVKLNQRVRQNLDSISNTQKLMNQKADEIKKLEQERFETIAKAKMPLDGLSFGDDGLLYDGLPFTEEQLSTSKLIEVGIGIQMALNPALRIMKVKDGSLLDSEKLAAIKKAARDNDYQLFMEKVTDSKEIGFHIEEDSDSEYQNPIECPTCNGGELLPANDVECPDCNNVGSVRLKNG